MTRQATARRAPLVLVVGPDTTSRVEVARSAIGRGYPVVLCGGPPSCPLLRGEQCPIVEATDVAVFMPPEAHERAVIAGLSMCASRAHHVVLAEFSNDPDDDTVTLDPESVVDRGEASVAGTGRHTGREVSS